MGTSGYRYDAFISHAVEDKIPIANELCERLEEAGLRIWYSGKELNAGDSINTTIDAGLEESRYGVVIFSQHYIRKTWTLREFYMLLGKEKEGRKIILPVLYDVTPEELALKDLVMADRFAIRTDKGLDHVVDKLVKTIHQDSKVKRPRRPMLWPVIMVLVVIALLLGALKLYPLIIDGAFRPSGLNEAFVDSEIRNRIDKLQHKVDRQYLVDLQQAGAEPSEPAAVNTFFTDFRDLKSYYRNEYEFFNGYTTIRSRKNVEAALRLDLSACAPANAYQFHSPAVYLVGKKPEVRYAFVNTQPVQHQVLSLEEKGTDAYAVTVAYDNNIRLIAVNLLFVKHQQETRRHRMYLVGLLPTETYVFEKHGGRWAVAEVK